MANVYFIKNDGKPLSINGLLVPRNPYDRRRNESLILETLLGQGAYGAVLTTSWQGEHCAVKVQKKTLAAGAKELRHMGNTDSPYVIKAKDHFTDQHFLYIVMELCEGALWSDSLSMEPLLRSSVQKVAHDVAQGRKALHARQIVHRDLKPQNILITEVGAKVGDLGLAIHVQDIRGVAGTRGYLAPEVEQNKEYGLFADIFSLGVVLHEALTGQVVRAGGSQLAKIDPEAHHLIGWMLQDIPRHRPEIEEVLAHPFCRDDGMVAADSPMTGTGANTPVLVEQDDEWSGDEAPTTALALSQAGPLVIGRLDATLDATWDLTTEGAGTMADSWSEVMSSLERVGNTQEVTWPEVMSPSWE
ncbi:hypothetical protein BGX29_000763 [Mortierella sp. GBA35]|nr:hypothetical protein BGX29_000763 [Mortierella sp. GBA35]